MPGKTIVLMAAAAVMVAACTGSKALPTRLHTSFEARASSSLSQIEQGRCSDTAKQFDPLVKRRLDAAGLCSAFTTYTELLGSVTKAEAPYSQRRGMLTVVRVPLTLSHGHGEYRVTYHPDGSVAGIYFLKPGAPVG